MEAKSQLIETIRVNGRRFLIRRVNGKLEVQKISYPTEEQYSTGRRQTEYVDRDERNSVLTALAARKMGI